MNKIIKTADEHAEAITQLSALMDADPAPGSAQADELELLAHLISVQTKHAFRLRTGGKDVVADQAAFERGPASSLFGVVIAVAGRLLLGQTHD